MTLILAGNHAEAEAWRARKGLRWRDVRYISKPEDARGYSGPCIDVAVVGTFWSRKDAEEIKAAVANCMGRKL